MFTDPMSLAQGADEDVHGPHERVLGPSVLDHSGNSAETHPFTGGRKRVRSEPQPTDYGRPDSPTFLNQQTYI